MKIIFLETREKMENFDIKYVIFREELYLLWFIDLKINNNKNLKMKTLAKIMKLNNLVTSKYYNLHMNGKLTIRGFQRD